jgi:hypothetical protein
MGYEYYTYDEKPVIISKNAGFLLLEDRGQRYIDMRDPEFGGLRDQVNNSLTDMVEEELVDDFGHRYPLSFLTDFIPLFESQISHTNKRQFLAVLKGEQKRRMDSYGQRKKKGLVEMGDIQTVFPVGIEVVAKTYDEGLIGGVVKTVKLVQSFWGTYWNFTLSVVHAVKGEIQQGLYRYEMPAFRGLVKLADLPVRPATPADKKELTERGKKFAKFLKPGTYVAYKGTLEQPSWFSSRTYRADGRVVIDPVSFERQEPEVWRDCINRCGVEIGDNNSRGGKVRSNTEIGESDYWRCLPQLYGFSLAVKQWGRLDLDGMEDIKWRDDAWDKLVVDEEKKDMIFSLVKFHGKGFTDIIEGKGGGTIFLLHGPPGWGKTASAEAVAELLHKPLYSVSVGELGTSTDALEQRLRNILDVAVIWDAVLLLDEADIFLEERDEHNIARNAMVGVFLRLLEYHNGVLFLTTNRVKKIDPAFYSRISVALHYRKEGKAQQIWHNLLKAAGLDSSWAEELSGYDVNGRQIKNSIRMAMTFALSKSRKVQVSDLVRAVMATISFEDEMKGQHNVYVEAPADKKRKTKAKAAAAATPGVYE